MCSFHKATYTIRLFVLTSHPTKFSDMAACVRGWNLNPGYKLPTSVWFSDGYMLFSSQTVIWRKLKIHTRFPQLQMQQCGGILQVCVQSCCTLTHWGRMTHICISKIIIIGSDNGLSPGRRQAIIWTDAGILLIEPLGTNFSEILIEIHTFSFQKMHLKTSSAKWRLFRLGLNVLMKFSGQMMACSRQLTHKHCCASISHRRTKGLRPLLWVTSFIYWDVSVPPITHQWFLELVGLDTSHKEWLAGFQGSHQQVQGLLELGP